MTSVIRYIRRALEFAMFIIILQQRVLFLENSENPLLDILGLSGDLRDWNHANMNVHWPRFAHIEENIACTSGSTEYMAVDRGLIESTTINN